MAESSASASQKQTLDSSSSRNINTTPELVSCASLIPMPSQAGHLPMAFRPIYHFDEHTQTWIASMPTASSVSASNITHFNVITWNIDFMQPYGKERYTAAINYLERFLTRTSESRSSSKTIGPTPSSTIILFQEIDQRLIEYIINHDFVRQFFMTTDISGHTWLNDSNVYGVVALVPIHLRDNVASVFRTNFPGTRMGREALYVDLLLPNITTPNTEDMSIPEPNKEHEALSFEQKMAVVQIHVSELHANVSCIPSNGSSNYLRVCNVHLESLRGRSDDERKEQLGSTVAFLAAPGVRIGIVAGDMNPIGPDDDELPTRLGFTDAWITDSDARRSTNSKRKLAGANDSLRERERGGVGEELVEGEAENCREIDSIMEGELEMDFDRLGYTWGYQPPTRFSPRRMDKVLVWGASDVELLGIEKIAEKLEVEVSDDIDDDDDGEKEMVWVTDHCGLLARFRI